MKNLHETINSIGVAFSIALGLAAAYQAYEAHSESETREQESFNVISELTESASARLIDNCAISREANKKPKVDKKLPIWYGTPIGIGNCGGILLGPMTWKFIVTNNSDLPLAINGITWREQEPDYDRRGLDVFGEKYVQVIVDGMPSLPINIPAHQSQAIRVPSPNSWVRMTHGDYNMCRDALGLEDIKLCVSWLEVDKRTKPSDIGSGSLQITFETGSGTSRTFDIGHFL